LNLEWQKVRIQAGRFQSNFDALAAIGSSGDGGVSRPAMSEAHLAARQWFKGRVLSAGLQFYMDPAGNHFARLECGPSGAPAILLGSHLDSVPNGGRFDGALGVVAALEVLQTVQDSNLKLPVNLEAVDFTDEEGTLIDVMGSAALAGQLSLDDFRNPRGGREALLAGFQRFGLAEETVLQARRDPRSLAGYLELHIEQGPRLENSAIQIGVVTKITGIGAYRLIFSGRADHAGTTPMSDRKDASLGAAAFILSARTLVLESFPGSVANCGAVALSPGAFNIVPARAILSLEYRSPDPVALDSLEQRLLAQAESDARRFRLGLTAESLGKHLPSSMHPDVQSAIEESAAALGLKSIRMASGAWHDAQMMTAICPAGMLFVPSAGGASHSPAEFSRWEDCLNGANVLLQAALRLAAGETDRFPTQR
jgi:N-carbamoyl-L-amino-acid hydrolase